jgi:hypothetical protein
VAQHGRHGGSIMGGKVAQTVVLQSRVQIQSLPSPQLTAICGGLPPGWHLAAG